VDPLPVLKGLVIGFALAVPIGPVGILCVRKSLAEGHSRGLVIGLGSATADAIFAGIAAFGITFITGLVDSQRLWVHLAGGVLLIWLGVRTYRVKRKGPILPFESFGAVGSYVSAFMLALTNPVTIIAFMVVFTAFGLSRTLTVVAASSLVLGVFAGSFLWFLTLNFVATSFRRRLDSGGLAWVNRIAGGLIIVSGVAAFVTLF
jgi:threonine/homoserine/homoserine lactone efflux protein